MPIMDAAQTTQPFLGNTDAAVGAAIPPERSATEPVSDQPSTPLRAKMSLAQIVLALLVTIGFFYFARPVVLPIFLACVAGMTLKPLIRWLSGCRIPPALSAAVVLLLLISAAAFGFFELGRPAVAWANDAPQHLADLRQRIERAFPRFNRFSQAAAAVNNLGASEQEKREEQRTAPTVQVK